MKNKSGFTLVELLAVITILSVILVIGVPTLLKSLSGRKSEALEKTYNVIETAALNYTYDYSLEKPAIVCIEDLCDKYLDCPVISPTTKEELTGCVFVNEDIVYTDEIEVSLDVQPNGGILSQQFNDKYEPGYKIELKEPTKEGYDFAGWKVVKGNSIIKENTLTIGTTDTIIYALWNEDSILTIDLDGGSVSESQEGTYKIGAVIELIAPTKEGYTFSYWKLVSGIESGVISGNTFTMGSGNAEIKAVYEGNKYIVTLNANGGFFSHTLYTEPNEYVYVVPGTGEYELEVWGAQGGSNGGYGGYSKGNVYLNKDDNIFINVGGHGSRNAGGYNGGGNGQQKAGTANPAAYGGGGASHISKESGLLKDIKIENVYIIAGGGGGMGENGMIGGHAGGYIGNNGTGTCYIATGGTQLAGGTRGDSDATNGGYGYGGNAPSGSTTSGTWGAGGGGSGYYGGGGNSFKSGSNCAGGGAGGSGYIGNALLTNKAMYCYNCNETEEESTKTISISTTSEKPISKYSKLGDGAVKINKIIEQINVAYNSVYGQLPIPTRGEYIFKGWYTEPNGNGINITNSTTMNVINGVKLYAYWEENGATYITNLLNNESTLNNGLKQTTATISGNTVDSGIRYVGANPNNKVYFNCKDKDSNNIEYAEANYDYANSCEIWRIIGVFNVDNGSGKIEKRIKIVRDPFSVKMSWDSSASGVNNGNGINQWGKSGLYEGADLMKLLNGYYIGEEMTCKYCNGAGQEICENDCTSGVTPLSNKSLSMVEDAIWNLGSPTYSASISLSTMYTAEKGTQTGKTCSSGQYCNDDVERTTEWVGKIGLIYPSDYGYASTDSSCSSDIIGSNNTCNKNNWLHSNDYDYLTISPFSYSDYARYVRIILSYYRVIDAYANVAYSVRPSLYLSSVVKITGGDGNTEPYRLGL